MASVMIVDAEQLDNVPQAFRQYVERYFQKTTCLGKTVYVATRYLHLDLYKSRSGFAPRHSLDLACFTEGLAKDETLGGWISKARGKLLWEFEGGYDSDSVVKD